jgi:2,4-dienoyl-CoA reductase-like NADH-dependent reductase (Old Yellow Enzyme family)
MQIVHGGIQAGPELNDMDLPAGPSPIRVRGMKETSRELDAAEIAAIVEDFGRAAGRVRESGFDAVQLHVAHGYLLSQFLSPLANQRKDGYGGPIDHRARVVFETFEAVRSAVGPDFPVLIKINSEDFAEGGLTLEDSLWVADRLAQMGLDGVEVSGGLGWNKEGNPARVQIDAPEKEAYFRSAGRAFKSRLNIPIILVGGFRSPAVIEDVLAKAEADYVAMSRPLVREPDLIKRWMAGDQAPAACVSCNGCGRNAASGQGLSCVFAGGGQDVPASH